VPDLAKEVFVMRISARGAAFAVMGPAILAGPLALAPSAAAAAAPAAQATADAAGQPADTQMMLRAARQYAAGLRRLHGAASATAVTA
jgi:hypothetical protein